MDHIIPTARGGTDDLSNLRFVHLVVNRMKSSLLDEEFLAWIEVLAWHAHQKGSFPAALKSPSEVTIQLALSIGIRPTTEKAGYGTFKRRP
ncbi:MAG: HNH endonuclease [Planctomycetes bacterium]|nr:HNH endonuclease [Planctomycetota bacterium]